MVFRSDGRMGGQMHETTIPVDTNVACGQIKVNKSQYFEYT